MKIWVPTTPHTQLIDYGQRTLINDDGRVVPLAWSVSKIDDTTPVGVTKLTFKQEVANLETDCARYGLAGWCKHHDSTKSKSDQCANCVLERPHFLDAGMEVVAQDIERGRIEFNGVNAKLRVNGLDKTFTPFFWDFKTRKYVNTQPHWTIQCYDLEKPICNLNFVFNKNSQQWDVSSDSKVDIKHSDSGCDIRVSVDDVEVLALHIQTADENPNSLSIRCLKLYSMAGKKLVLSASDANGNYRESLDLEVVG